MWFQSCCLPPTMNLNTTPKIHIIALWLILLIVIFPLIIIYTLKFQTTIIEWNVITANSLHLSFPIILDPAGLIFSSAVLFISANIIQFSISYIEGDRFIPRFIHLVLLFILSINILIFIPNLIILLLGWDGLGITSFILVIYYQNPKSLSAGIITALTNRIGDVIILLSIAWSLNQAHWNILNIWSTTSSHIITFVILLAAITKRAQLPFSSWLPAAIAAPTPVSALVHSSTLVTAGVFILIRFYPFLHTMPLFNSFLLIVASLTILIAGISAIVECDIKKIIALSTLRQLGVIIARLGLNLPNLAFFHLITHAIFKALLFICAGNFIKYHHHSQDLRFMGSLYNQSPAILTNITIANLALCGTPFLAGFYSKDIIIESLLFFPNNSFIILIFALATCLTSAYSARFIINIAWRPSLSLPYHSINNSNKNSIIPSSILTFGAVISGAILNWSYIFPFQDPFISLISKLLPLLSIILSVTLITYFNTTITFIKIPPIPLYLHSSALIWFITPLSSQFIINKCLAPSLLYLKVIDQGWNETLGGQGTQFLISSSSKIKQKFISNIITRHLTIIALTLIPLIILLYLDNLNKI